MKTYRLEKDLNWNYGIRIQKDYATFTGKRIDIFCFKMSEIPELGALFQIDKGFWFSFAFAFDIHIEQWFNWDLTTKKGRTYKKQTYTKK